MRTIYLSLLIVSLFCGITGCKKNSNNVCWDDSRTSGHYKVKGALWGSDDNIASSDKDGFIGPADEDFIPLKDEDLKAQFADKVTPQSNLVPGAQGSGIPKMDKFRAPLSQLASIFRNVLFNTDDHILRGKEALATIDSIADYLLEHPDTFVFIEGHADERGPEAYNLALGARRANYVRTLLVQRGVNNDQLHTVSYGKEKPLVIGHGADAWTKNRRAQFKIYQSKA